MKNKNDSHNIDRRDFIIKNAKCAACMALLPMQKALPGNSSLMRDKNDTKKIFLKKGTCSQTFYFLLNREFGHNKEEEEKAIDPLAGGIMQKGYQCGMLWGSSMAAGTESFRRNKNESKAIAQSIISTQHLLTSFINYTKTTDCKVITNTDFSKKLSLLKLIFFKTGNCLRIAKRWTAKAITAAKEGLLDNDTPRPKECMSCTTELARRMGANKEEMITVSGLAGGLGLSGNACGALSAAIWLKTLYWSRQNPEKTPTQNQEGEKTMTAFEEETAGKYLCSEITGKQFSTIDEHTKFMKNGGCSRLLDILSQTNEANFEPKSLSVF